jgi:hypothetical protein
MNSAAQELIQAVEANGGRLVIEGDYLVVYPSEAGEPLVEELRRHKPAIIALLLSRTADPLDDQLDGEWMLEECVYVDRWWGGIGALYLSLARWLAERGRPVPASRTAFVAALQSEGFQVTSDGLVYGLILKEDWLAYCAFQNRPAQTEKPFSGKTRYKSSYTPAKKGA